MVVTIGTTVGGNFKILPAASLMIEGHGDERRSDGVESFPTNRAVFAVVGNAPGASFGCNQRLVTIVIVGEHLGRLGEVDLVSLGRNEVFGFFAVRGSLRKSRVCFEIGESASGGIVEEVTTEVVGTEPEGRVLVDRDRRIRVRFAANRRVTGRCARSVLVQVVRLISRGLGFAPLVIGRRRTAVTDGVVVEVLREAGDGLTILRATGRSQLGAGIVGIAVDGAREVAEGGADLRDGNATTRRVVGVVELGNDVGRRGVADLQELVVGVVCPAGGEAIWILERGLEVGARQVSPLESVFI